VSRAANDAFAGHMPRVWDPWPKHYGSAVVEAPC